MAPMLESVAQAFVFALAAYASLGLTFAVPFVWFGVRRLDSEAAASGVGFRLLILQGVAAFWPMFLFRWVRRITEPPVEKNPHR